MNNFNFLQIYVELQHGIMFDELVDLDFATVCYGQNDSSPFWNNALTNQELNSQQINTIELRFKELKRKPAFYFENREELHPFVRKLELLGYEQIAEDSFMFYDGEKIDESRFQKVKKVETEQDLEVYIQTFNTCYQKDDPQNPYGELGEYLDAARKVWFKHHTTKRLEYFIIFDGNNPVAVSTLTNHKGIGYISNVGSLRSVRGGGYGKLATLYCVSQSKKNGNTTHCLITEEGTNPNQFYSAIGFKTKFTAKLMVELEKKK